VEESAKKETWRQYTPLTNAENIGNTTAYQFGAEEVSTQ
jgi:hypothetical protein